MEGVSAKGTALWMTLMELCSKTGCHQRPDRSFFLFGCQMPLCARCTGIALGQLAGAIVSAVKTPSALVSALLLVPCALDGGLQLLTGRPSTNARRFVTGILAGLGVAFLYVCAVKSILKALKRIG